MNGIDFILKYRIEIIFLSCLVLLIIILIINISNKSKIKKLHDNYQKFMSNGFDGENLDTIINKLIDEIQLYKSKSDKIKNNINNINMILSNTIQKVGLVRYKAFEDVGGDQSFSLALLSGDDNGTVISSIHGREQFSTYAKKIVNGGSNNKLSEEEIMAIEQARKENIQQINIKKEIIQQINLKKQK